MSILSTKKKTELSKREQQRAQQEIIDQQREHQVSRQGITTELLRRRDEILALDFIKRHKDDAESREYVTAQFARLLDLARQVDMSVATRDQRRILVLRLYKTAPYEITLVSRLANMKTAVLTSSFAETIPRSIEDPLEMIYRVLIDIQERQIQPPIADPALPAPVVQTTITFPAIDHQDERILAAVKRLGVTWQQAYGRNLSITDRFNVESLATSYLPDSLRLLENMSRYSEAARIESEKIFLEQVQLLQAQLDEILRHEEQAELSAMRAHSLFLKGKLEGATP